MSKKNSVLRATSVGIALAAISFTAGCAAPDPQPMQSEVELTSRAEPAPTESVDEIVWNLPQGEPNSIDPPNSPTFSGAGVVSNLCDPLLRVDESYNLESNLVSFEQVSPTELVYTLVADATFWDGSPVTIEDVFFSLQRAAAPEALVSFLFANVASIEPTGSDQVTITFTQPDVLFNRSMATFAGMVVQKEFTEAAGAAFGTSSGGVMCSGPFKFVSWTPGENIVIEKNDDYWNDELSVFAERVTFPFITDTAAYTQALNAGEINGSYQLDPSAVSALSSSGEGRLFYGPSMESTALNIVVPGGVLADPKLREAFQLMMDREAIAASIYQGAATPLYWSVTPATWPIDQKDRYQVAYDKWVEARAFDMDRAKALVEESGYDGSELSVAVAAGDETAGRIAQLVQQQAKEAGVAIKIEEVQPLDFAAASYDVETRERLGIDMIIGTSFNATQEPLEPMGFTVLPGAAYNSAEFEDDRVTELVTTALQTFDDDERAEMTLEAMEIVEEASFTIPLVSTNTVTFLTNDLTGAITSFAYLSMPSMAYIGR